MHIHVLNRPFRFHNECLVFDVLKKRSLKLFVRSFNLIKDCLFGYKTYAGVVHVK